MKIITYNVNGLRAAVTKGFPEWLALVSTQVENHTYQIT